MVRAVQSSSPRDRGVKRTSRFANLFTLTVGERYSNNEKYKDIVFANIDVDALSDLCDELDVQAMPTLMMFKQGNKVTTAVDPDRAGLIKLLESSLD